MRTFLKAVLGTLLGSVGLAICRKIQIRNMSTVLHHIHGLGFNPKTVIDVGVADGTPELYETFSGSGSTFLLVEPLAEWETALKAICKKYNATYVLAAAGESPGKVDINKHAVLSGSSIFNESDGSVADGRKGQVSVVTLDDLCSEKQLQGPYLIKVDTQGYELKVLEGAKKIIADTEYILLEVSLFEFYLGGPQLYDVVKYMKDIGFVAYDFTRGNHRPIDGALAQVDIAFVKENGQFRKHHQFATAGGSTGA